MLKAKFNNGVQKFLNTRIPKHHRQISAKINSLCSVPNPSDCRKVTGKFKGYRRAKIGEYRIIYFVEADVLHIVRIGKRNDSEAYK